MWVWLGDTGGNQEIEAAALGQGPMTLSLIVCDGRLIWQAGERDGMIERPSLFRLRSDLPNSEYGSAYNDSVLWMGVNRVVGNASRTGAGTHGVELNLLE